MRQSLSNWRNKYIMIIVKRGKITYYVKEEAIIVGVNDFQYTAYTVYPLQNRKPFYDFRRKILKSEENEYADIISLIQLAQKHNLKGVASHRPSEEEKNR
jgi:hypothetical protein